MNENILFAYWQDSFSITTINVFSPSIIYWAQRPGNKLSAGLITRNLR